MNAEPSGGGDRLRRAWFGRTRRRVTEPGKWYFVVACAACQQPIPLAEAPSPQEKPDPLRYRTLTGVHCPHCGHVDTYAPVHFCRRLVL